MTSVARRVERNAAEGEFPGERIETFLEVIDTSLKLRRLHHLGGDSGLWHTVSYIRPDTKMKKREMYGQHLSAISLADQLERSG